MPYIELTSEDYKRAEANGISRNTAYNRYYNYFWDKETALTKPPRPKNKSGYLSIAIENGIDSQTFWQRVNVYKWDEETAATTPPLTKEQIAERNRKRTRKHPEWVYDRMKENGITTGMLSTRLCRLKWTLEEACSVPPGTQLVDYYRNKVRELESKIS